MQRKCGELVPIGDALTGLDGSVKAILDATPQARHHFTRFDQVNQLVSAREADPDLGFMARLMALCSLPRTNPSNRLQYKRTNGPYTLYMTSGGGNKLPYGTIPRLLLALGLDRSGEDPKPCVGFRELALRLHAGAGDLQQRRQAPNPGSATKWTGSFMPVSS